jgi:hypothetical protein
MKPVAGPGDAGRRAGAKEPAEEPGKFIRGNADTAVTHGWTI